MSDNDSKQVEKLDRLYAVGAITRTEWRDGRRRLLGLKRLVDYGRIGPGQFITKTQTDTK